VSDDLNVWCVCVGDKYHSGYVYALQEAVAKNLSVPHRFRCITTRKLECVETRNPPVPYAGWWSKIGLFAPDVATGPSLYFDLDVVITGALDYLVEFTRYEFAAPANWARSGYGGIQSSVMAWRGNWTKPYDKIHGEWPSRVVDGDGYTTLAGKKFWGDQEYLWDLLGDEWVRVPGVCSYKYHVAPHGRIPNDASVVVFHGEPKPIDVSDECISPFTATLRRSISASTRNGSRQDVSATA
jgi:hypothetical protein